MSVQLRTVKTCPKCGSHVQWRTTGGPWRTLTAASTDCVRAAQEREATETTHVIKEN